MIIVLTVYIFLNINNDVKLIVANNVGVQKTFKLNFLKSLTVNRCCGQQIFRIHACLRGYWRTELLILILCQVVRVMSAVRN